jgi:hypothetical protein
MKLVNSRRNIWIDPSFDLSEQTEDALVENDLHSAIRVRDQEGNPTSLMIFADEEYFHVIDMQNENSNPSRFE